MTIYFGQLTVHRTPPRPIREMLLQEKDATAVEQVFVPHQPSAKYVSDIVCLEGTDIHGDILRSLKLALHFLLDDTELSPTAPPLQAAYLTHRKDKEGVVPKNLKDEGVKPKDSTYAISFNAFQLEEVLLELLQKYPRNPETKSTTRSKPASLREQVQRLGASPEDLNKITAISNRLSQAILAMNSLNNSGRDEFNTMMNWLED